MAPVHVKYGDIISLENLFLAWREFLKDKRKKKDVAEFSLHLLNNIISLHRDLASGEYRHGGYQPFKVNDPKPRDIHKASVRDRLLHHAIYRVLYPYFDRKFVFNSFSCRKKKGTHRALGLFRRYGRIVSRNNTRTCWVLKCDVKKFFASINHEVLVIILRKHIADKTIIALLKNVIESFRSENGKGLPLGNLTSQLLVNIYMNDFDHFVKRILKVRYYIRYADDFVIFHNDRNYLCRMLPQVSGFLGNHLKLALHPDKVFLKPLASGVDFLGWIHFSHQRILRTVTRRRILKKIDAKNQPSYLGLLNHGDTYQVKKAILNFLGQNGKM